MFFLIIFSVGFIRYRLTKSYFALVTAAAITKKVANKLAKTSGTKYFQDFSKVPVTLKTKIQSWKVFYFFPLSLINQDKTSCRSHAFLSHDEI